MLEVNPIYLILLTEGAGLLFLALLGLFGFIWFRRRQRRRVIADLTRRLRTEGPERRQFTELFLQAAYNLDGDELRQVAQAIELRETEFLQQLIETLDHVDREKMELLDLSLKTMIESYKHMEPRVDDNDDPMARQIEELLEQNERLREELSVAKNTMSQMVAEFAEMFAGGREHDLPLEQVLANITGKKPDLEFTETDYEPQK